MEQPKKRVVIESPLRGDYVANKAYARACMRDSILKGEAPYTSHLLFAQDGLLDDTNEEERRLGMEAGFAWGKAADLVAVYTDNGISDGMKRGIESAQAAGVPVEYRDGVTAEVGGREAMLAAIAAEPKDSRIFAMVVSPDGELSGHYSGGFRVWEMQGLLEFFRVQATVRAANAMMGEQEEGQGGDESDNDHVM